MSSATLSGSGTLSGGSLSTFEAIVTGGATLKSTSAASMSTFTLSGGTVNTAGTMLEGGPILIDGGSSSWNTGMLTDPSTANVTISNGGNLTSDGVEIDQNSSFTITGSGSNWSIGGEFDANSGKFSVMSGGQLSTGLVHLGSGPTGGAQLTVDGANSTWNLGDETIIGFNPGTSTVFLKNGAVVPVTHDLVLGEAGSGSVFIQSGSQMHVIGKTFFKVGDAAGGSGGVSIDGANSLLQIDEATVGAGSVANSSGSFSITGGGTMYTGFMGLALAPGSNGSVSVSGAGSSWTNGDNTFIGIEGNATFTVDSGGKFLVEPIVPSPSLAFTLGQKNGSTGSAGVMDAGSSIDLRKVRCLIGDEAGNARKHQRAKPGHARARRG